MYESSKLKSQKAKGIYYLTQTGYIGPFNPPSAKFFPYEIKPKYPFFARPCPTTPRHGFVDSRVINNDTEWGIIQEEIAATGEPVEIVCMDFIQADYSGILTPQGVTFGKGNDGATAGTSAKFIPSPMTYQKMQGRLNFYGQGLGIIPPNVAYGEFVGKYDGVQPTLVQLRSGPVVVGSTKYVPVETLVKQVVKAEGDLLEWETKATKFTPGTVVWHPHGALSSHYAVHCILNNVPVICEIKSPQVGDILQVENAVPKLTQEDYNVLAQYLATAIATPIKEKDEAKFDQLKTALATFHSSSLWGGEDHLLQLRARGIASIFRFAAAACFGELRHFSCHGPGGGMETPLEWDSCHTYSRDYVFNKIYSHNIRAILEAFPCVVRDCSRHGWSRAFGGSSWAACSTATLRLGVGIQHFLHKKNKKSWNKLVAGWNATVNAVHNNGGLLSKHISSNFLDEVAITPFLGFINPYCAKVVLGDLKLDRNKKPGKVLPLNSRKPALELYPFKTTYPGFKVVIADNEELTGLFTATIRSSGNYSKACVITFPFVMKTNDPGRPLNIWVEGKKYCEAVGKKDLKVQVMNGRILALIYGTRRYQIEE